MLLRSNYTNENDESCVVIEICESEDAPVLKRYLYYYNKDLLKNDIMEESYKSGVEDLSDFYLTIVIIYHNRRLLTIYECKQSLHFSIIKRSSQKAAARLAQILLSKETENTR